MQLSNYVDKIFFFCLKRCNNRMDAEDLSQTILTEAFISINKNNNIEDLEKYIFQIAYNKYSKYIDNKVKDRNLLDYEFELDRVAVEDSSLNELIEDEKLKKLNLQLKLLSSDYMNIVYSYYVEDLKLSEIAKNLNLPLGTVKRKLFEIRNKIKEQLTMEKFNGKKAYIPKNYLFTKACSNVGTYDPHDYVSTLIQQNLLYHSYNNPCTLEDFAIELGISMPYIEDLVNTLEEVTLIKKIDGKYVTNFAFLSKTFREEMYDVIRSYKNTFCKNLVDLAISNFDEFKRIGFSNNDKENGKLLWNYIMILLLTINEDAKLELEFSPRPGNGKWDFLGLELLDKRGDIYFVGFNYNNTYEYISHKFDIAHPSIYNRLIFDEHYLTTITYLKKNYINKLSEVEDSVRQKIDELITNGIVRIENDEIKYNCMVFTEEEYQKLKEFLNGLNLDDLVKQYKEIFEDLKKKVMDYIPSYLENQAAYIAFGLITDLRSLSFNYAEENNLLDFCINDKKFVYNFYVILAA